MSATSVTVGTAPSVTLQAGQCVARGQQIAVLGRPRSSPHLHFEIRKDGSAVDPLAYVRQPS